MKKILLIGLAAYSSTAAFAQKETDIKVDINKDGGTNWYSSPWVWVVAAAVFVLVLVALTRGNRRSDNS